METYHHVNGFCRQGEKLFQNPAIMNRRDKFVGRQLLAYFLEYEVMVDSIAKLAIRGYLRTYDGVDSLGNMPRQPIISLLPFTSATLLVRLRRYGLKEPGFT